MSALLIKGGLICDGTGSEPKNADILLEGGRVAKIAAGINAPRAEKIDAVGKIIVPGFVRFVTEDSTPELLTHRLQNRARLAGVTTQIVGAGGYSETVLSGPHNKQAHIWSGVKDFLNFFRHRSATNLGVMVGWQTVRHLSQIKQDERDLSDKELAAGINILKEALKEGALGVSVSFLKPLPFLELKEVFQVVAETGRLFAFRLPPTISQAAGRLMDLAGEVAGNAENILVKGFTSRPRDAEECSAFATYLKDLSGESRSHFDMVPFGNRIVPVEEILPPGRRQNLDVLTKSLEEFKIFNYSVFKVADPALKFLEGKKISDLAENRGETFGRALAEIIRLTKGKLDLLASFGDVETLRNLAADPHAILDPEWGEGERLASWLKEVYEQSPLNFSQAIRKLSLMPAEKAGLMRRGALKAGWAGDVCVLENFKPTETIVNGMRILEDNRHLPGETLTFNNR
jgi:N-acyl-D-amino-acid deacylase